ncbi:unnamed protein product [Camellia sinensis]
MEVDMETSPSYFDPEDLSTRERYRRYGKRHSTSSHDNSVSKFSGTRILYDGQSIERRPNAALFLEDIKQEVESFDADQLEGTPAKTQSGLWRKSLAGSRGVSEADVAADSIHRPGSYSLKSCKHEDDALSDGGDTTFTLFASLLDSALQGLMPIPDLILQFERSCRNVSESIRMKIGAMRKNCGGQVDEAEGNEELPEDMMLFVVADHTAQLGLRIVQWLEALASKVLDLDNEVRGSHVGTYLPSSGVWHHTQRALKKGVSKPKTVHHLDFDAPTCEHAEQLPDDKEACDLCRSAGQPWRAATLCPFGGLDLCPSVEALVKNGKNRTLQAIELESGIGHQWRLWKWAAYCVSERIAEQDGGKYETAVYAAQCSNLKRILPICIDWESASWAMAKPWLDVQVDLELARLQPGGMDQFKTYDDAIDRSHGQGDGVSPSTVGPENWPLQVLNQQPWHLSPLLQKLHSSNLVHEAITQECKEQHRQIEMNLMMGDIPHQLDVMWSWISPSEDEENVFRPHGDPQMIRFGAHLVLVLRYLLVEQMKGAFKEKIMTVGDLILHIDMMASMWSRWLTCLVKNDEAWYVIFLFSKHHEELVGIYASQLAHHRCIDLFVHMMELRLNSSDNVTVPRFSQLNYVSKIIRVVIKEVTGWENALLPTILDTQKDYKILKYECAYDSKGSFKEIVERVLSRSREIKAGKYDKSSDIAEQHQLQSLQKAMVVQWLCFTPPSTINDAQASSAKLLLRALLHRVFQIIGEKCGGLLEVDRRTIALDNLFEARLKVRGFDSGFLPAFMEVKVEGRSSMVCLKSLSKTVRRQVETWPKVFRPAPSSDPIAGDMEVDGSGRTRGNLVRGSRRGEGVEGSGDRFGDVVEVGGRPRDRGIKMILNGPQMEHDGPSKILGSSDLLHVGQEFNYQKPISVFPRDGPFSKQYKEYNGGPNRSNILFREFALISMWRVPAMPIGAHTLLSFLAEPLKQPTETLLSTEDHDVSENLREFQDWSEYYSCDATYRNWPKVELENVEVSPLELSVEEKQRAIAAGKENPLLVPTEDRVYESVEPLFLELHAIAMLCLPSGECMCLDATLCATLMSALYSSVSEEVVLNHQLMVSVSISSTDNYCIEVVLRGLATDGDGLGPHELNDGGILATVIAAGFKGELVRFQAGITMEISRLDAWYSSKDGSLEGPAAYIVRGLCRRCCIPEVILRCMQISVSLVESGNPHESHDELIELVALPETGFRHLFSQHQLQRIFIIRERILDMQIGAWRRTSLLICMKL